MEIAGLIQRRQLLSGVHMACASPPYAGDTDDECFLYAERASDLVLAAVWAVYGALDSTLKPHAIQALGALLDPDQKAVIVGEGAEPILGGKAAVRCLNVLGRLFARGRKAGLLSASDVIEGTFMSQLLGLRGTLAGLVDAVDDNAGVGTPRLHTQTWDRWSQRSLGCQRPITFRQRLHPRLTVAYALHVQQRSHINTCCCSTPSVFSASRHLASRRRWDGITFSAPRWCTSHVRRAQTRASARAGSERAIHGAVRARRGACSLAIDASPALLTLTVADGGVLVLGRSMTKPFEPGKFAVMQIHLRAALREHMAHWPNHAAGAGFKVPPKHVPRMAALAHVRL